MTRGVQALIKVLIVDDEVRICHLLEKLIDWRELDMEVIGIANDGITAYEQILHSGPDIVITDIRMSGYDGIELIRKTREAEIPAHFIIVSGYRQFEYAKNAIRYGAADYILKPISKDELTGILKNLKKQIESERDSLHREEKLLRNIESGKTMMRRQFLMSLLSERQFSESDVGELFGTELNGQSFRVLLVKIKTPGKETENSDLKNLLGKKIASSLEKELESLGAETITVIEQDVLVCAFLYEQGSELLISEWTKGIWSHLKTLLGEYGESRITIGLGSAANAQEELTHAMKSAKDALDMRFFSGSDRLILAERAKSASLRLSDILTSETRERLEKSIEAFDASSFSDLCTGLFEKVKRSGSFNAGLLFELKNEIYRIMKRIYGLQESELEQRLKLVSAAYDYQEFLSAFMALMCGAMNRCHEERKLQEEQPIRLAKGYIDEHYTQPITLEEVATVANLSPAYFSAVFKKYTDKNFSEYLIERRIKESKRLLRETTFNIKEISDKVGYRDQKYFSKLFVKVTGLKPSEFRKLYS